MATQKTTKTKAAEATVDNTPAQATTTSTETAPVAAPVIAPVNPADCQQVFELLLARAKK